MAIFKGQFWQPSGKGGRNVKKEVLRKTARAKFINTLSGPEVKVLDFMLKYLPLFKTSLEYKFLATVCRCNCFDTGNKISEQFLTLGPTSDFYHG